jgi:3-oxoadipate enol-lactonase
MPHPWKTEHVPGRPRIAVDHMGEGPLLVFLHGIGGNRTNWHDQLPVFAEEFHAMSWDARGYGRSDDYDGPLDFGDFSADLVRLLDHFGARTAHLVGLSMGGRIIMDFWGRHPDRVATLTICDSHPGFSALPLEKRQEFLRLRQAPLLEGKDTKDIAPVVAKTLIGRSAPPEIFQRLVDSMTALRKQSYLKSLEGTITYGRQPNFGSFRVPTHVVVGDEDTLTTPAVAREMAAQIPGAKLTVIEGAGHLSNIEQPARFNAAVLNFLRGAGKAV